MSGADATATITPSAPPAPASTRLSVNIWRTIHPLTSVVPNLPATMGLPFWFSVAAYMLLLLLLLMLRVNLGKRQAALDELYLAYED